ncbi:hypothetical protein ILUMI_09337 [Ignelater luminosus]|uniref:TIL domain-containing protein n=1 Tax=Ignelater luminosus TaxID=2038154 RepID=A0A8K0D066_IGNLU|nr:hypothetical protein ILUMI_09337 [Ignelater luminosus]
MAGIQTISFLVITACLLLSATAHKECGPNEVFEENYDIGCEPSCKVPDKTGLLCAAQPQPGCACKKGFYRSTKRECLTLEQCKANP